MKVTCHVCQKEDDDGVCCRILLGGTAYYAHDECALDALNNYSPEKHGEETPSEAGDLTDSAFLRDLAEKLMHVAPAMMGTDQGHAERRLKDIAVKLDKAIEILGRVSPAPVKG